MYKNELLLWAVSWKASPVDKNNSSMDRKQPSKPSVSRGQLEDPIAPRPPSVRNRFVKFDPFYKGLVHLET